MKSFVKFKLVLFKKGPDFKHLLISLKLEICAKTTPGGGDSQTRPDRARSRSRNHTIWTTINLSPNFRSSHRLIDLRSKRVKLKASKLTSPRLGRGREFNVERLKTSKPCDIRLDRPFGFMKRYRKKGKEAKKRFIRNENNVGVKIIQAYGQLNQEMPDRFQLSIHSISIHVQSSFIAYYMECFEESFDLLLLSPNPFIIPHAANTIITILMADVLLYTTCARSCAIHARSLTLLLSVIDVVLRDKALLLGGTKPAGGYIARLETRLLRDSDLIVHRIETHSSNEQRRI
ncbi:hypothetical protein EVAR_4613_1 [Eumeta japonica]|uniref:Uncharacterized protein n=1 Tax=Eumeta variegata TaxID=151549 RepID=A0A4C1SYZ6_EUMVA|nr:hypothetical protein EVAR_4613_1 [Eumeta japonica]